MHPISSLTGRPLQSCFFLTASDRNEVKCYLTMLAWSFVNSQRWNGALALEVCNCMQLFSTHPRSCESCRCSTLCNSCVHGARWSRVLYQFWTLSIPRRVGFVSELSWAGDMQDPRPIRVSLEAPPFWYAFNSRESICLRQVQIAIDS